MTFAHTTKVPVSRSRGEIERLLRSWECDGIQWTDDFRDGVTSLRFRWEFEGVDYRARMTIRIPSWEQLHTDKERKAHTQVNESTLQHRRDQRWRSLHRVLLLTIKANLNAVEAGLMTAVEAFLPHLEGDNGMTVAELAIPRLRMLTEQGGAVRLLEGE